MNKRYKAKCSVCGKMTEPRLPIEGRCKGDGTFWFPRRHKVNGLDCPGNIEEAKIVDTHKKGAPKEGAPFDRPRSNQ